jgi:hypothetical protein
MEGGLEEMLLWEERERRERERERVYEIENILALLPKLGKR